MEIQFIFLEESCYRMTERSEDITFLLVAETFVSDTHPSFARLCKVFRKTHNQWCQATERREDSTFLVKVFRKTHNQWCQATERREDSTFLVKVFRKTLAGDGFEPSTFGL